MALAVQRVNTNTTSSGYCYKLTYSVSFRNSASSSEFPMTILRTL